MKSIYLIYGNSNGNSQTVFLLLTELQSKWPKNIKEHIEQLSLLRCMQNEFTFERHF